MASVLRLLAAGLLALTCALGGCGAVAGVKVTFSADPLAVSVEVNGNATPTWQESTPPATTVPAGVILEIDGGTPAVDQANGLTN